MLLTRECSGPCCRENSTRWSPLATNMILSAVDLGKGSMTPCRMQGRFSGRLQSKADEAGLLNECPQLGPLLGGSLDPEVRACLHVHFCSILQ